MRLVHDDLVVLDVGQDLYSCLPEASSDLQFLGSGQIGCSEDLADMFRAEGWLAGPTTMRSINQSVRSVPVRRLDIPPACKTTGLATLRLLACWQRARQRRRWPLARQLEWAARRPTERSSSAELARCVSAFRAMMIVLPDVGECLFQSQLLLDFLRSYGLNAEWVFGVRTWPFAAHCWLEVEGNALVDDTEGLIAFHPIMVV